MSRDENIGDRHNIICTQISHTNINKIIDILIVVNHQEHK